MHNRKKALFSGLDMTIVTPSQWLADLVKQSFLKDYPVKVIHNGIDLNVFRPTDGDFRQRYGIPESKKILLGVAFGWGVRKGLDVFVELAKRLDPEQYRIVLVGTDDRTDAQLPKNIISIHRTNNQQELAQIYTAADLFVNPTREEVLGMVNLEAIACGTPVVTFRSGGSPECVDDTCGSVVDCDDFDGLEREIRRICAERPYSAENCLKRAVEFDANERFREYIRLYGSMLHES
jgi:glycosyltransferase involved in cell wall biosynthesis